MDVAIAAMFLPRMNVERDFVNKISQKDSQISLFGFFFSA